MGKPVYFSQQAESKMLKFLEERSVEEADV